MFKSTALKIKKKSEFICLQNIPLLDLQLFETKLFCQRKLKQLLTGQAQNYEKFKEYTNKLLNIFMMPKVQQLWLFKLGKLETVAPFNDT